MTTMAEPVKKVRIPRRKKPVEATPTDEVKPDALKQVERDRIKAKKAHIDLPLARENYNRIVKSLIELRDCTDEDLEMVSVNLAYAVEHLAGLKGQIDELKE